MSIFKIPFVFLFVFLIGIGSVFSQAKPSGKSEMKSPAAPIEIKANILVLDEKGNSINNLRAEDFKVFEDGIEQKITYFAEKKSILNLGLVVDNSGSLRTKFDEILRAASIIAANLRPDDKAFVMRFIDSNTIEIMQDWSSDQAKLREAIENMFIQGGQSAVLDAVYLSAEKMLEREKENKSEFYAIVLISDAEERDSFYSIDAIRKLFKGKDLPVFLLSYQEYAPLNKKKARFYSHLLALETGGTVYTLEKKHTKEDLNNILRAMVAELRSQYVIGYTSTNQKRDGQPRKLTIQIASGANGEKRLGFIREGFVIPKN